MRRALLLTLLLGVAAAPLAAAIDPFYRNRMENGYRAFEQGNWEEAGRQLRIACFGHLDEPVALVEGLIRLAVVEAVLGDEEAFRRLFSRLVELEERFSAYGAARVPAAIHRQFEGYAARLIPAQSLPAAAAFAPIVERADIQRLAQLPPERRRAELEAMLAAEPGRDDLLLELARLELLTERPRATFDWLDRLPAEAALRPPATCLRQQAVAESGACDRMDASQPFCSDVPPEVVEGRLRCLVEAARWAAAGELLAGMDPELRGRRRIARMARRVDDGLAAASEEGPPPAAPAPAPGETAPSTGEPAGGPGGPLVSAPAPPSAAGPAPSPLDPARLDRLRQRLASASSGAQLAVLEEEAVGLADRHPESREARLLAAEVAYLLSDWPAAVAHFRLAGELRPGETHLAFYQAVALYESGDRAAAAAVLRPVADRLERNRFVDAYVERILGAGI